MNGLAALHSIHMRVYIRQGYLRDFQSQWKAEEQIDQNAIIIKAAKATKNLSNLKSLEGATVRVVS